MRRRKTPLHNPKQMRILKRRMYTFLVIQLLVY